MIGAVIFLNGTSSSGKTSTVRALQDALEPPFLEMALDRLIFMLPARYLRPPLWDDVLGKATWPGTTGRTLFAGMHHAIAAAARLGNNIIADHVLTEEQWITECARAVCRDAGPLDRNPLPA
jgi:chloramphenicol 3-O phosphotransferase